MAWNRVANLRGPAGTNEADQRFEKFQNALPWKGSLPENTDLNDVREPGIYTIPTQTRAFTIVNIPMEYSGILKVWKADTSMVAQEFIGSGSDGYPQKLTRITRSSSSWTGEWTNDRSMQDFLPEDTDLQRFRVSGEWIITPEIAETLSDLPPGLPSEVHGVLQVMTTLMGSVTGAQTLLVHVNDGHYTRYERVTTSSRFPAWQESGQTSDTPKPAARDAGPYRHLDLVTRARHRRGGPIGTGKAAVALRFDHHLDPFMEKVLPLLKKYRLPWAQIVCPDRVGSYSTDANTTWVDLEQACLDSGGEVWNHGATHGDATTEAALRTEIVGSLESLETNLPRLPIEGWAPPGLGAGGYMGAAPFATVEQNTETYAGQLIMGHHALIAGYADGNYRVLDGHPPIGARHITVDRSTQADIASRLDIAQELDAGLALMLHPNLLDAEDRITTLEFEAILADIAARRDAGLIEVVSYSGLWFADASTDHRQDFAPKEVRDTSVSVAADAAHSVTMETSRSVRAPQQGSSKEIRIEFTADTSGTVEVSINGYETTIHEVNVGSNIVRRPITIPLDSGNLTVQMTPNIAGTMTGFHCYAI